MQESTTEETVTPAADVPFSLTVEQILATVLMETPLVTCMERQYDLEALVDVYRQQRHKRPTVDVDELTIAC